MRQRRQSSGGTARAQAGCEIRVSPSGEVLRNQGYFLATCVMGRKRSLGISLGRPDPAPRMGLDVVRRFQKTALQYKQHVLTIIVS